MATNKMLIDATHPEETRVVVLRGNRVEEFDFESAAKKQLRGNIYLAKVTRVEPSLQAAFVDYGGNRHGFLAFSEIHPDYYQIPVADRQALLAEEAHEEAERARGEERAAERGPRRRRRRDRNRPARRTEGGDVLAEVLAPDEPPAGESALAGDLAAGLPEAAADLASDPPAAETAAAPLISPADEPVGAAADTPAEPETERPGADAEDGAAESRSGDLAEEDEDEAEDEDEDEEEEVVEAVGGADVAEEVPERPHRVAPRRYKIQEVIKRRQVLLVQVVKEERGNKGAALTTYLSLAGRYSVLMPNTARGGGISRKITSADDRRRLKEIAQELEVPEGMGVILRTAGAARTKAEVKRDFEYLMRLWETVAELTLKSQAPALVYEEGSLVKRSIRDLYNKDIDEVVVAGDDGYRDAKEFMRMLMPSHAKNVKLYKEDVPLFTRSGIESQLDGMFQPQVQLKSGGYVVLNQTEALVAIDVNSGRATREHNIEDTALKTNLEAAEEIARQLRLRDLAGLVVIDFIDMEEGRNNRAVERRLKECLKQDRARIQVGRISHFGLLEMSRQRIRTSVLESTTETCPHCNGTGHLRSPASTALQILRMIEEALIRDPSHNVIVRTRARVALYVLNQKRSSLRALEERFGVTVTIDADEHLPAGTTYVIDKGELSTRTPAPRPKPVQMEPAADLEEVEDEAAEDEAEEASGERDAGPAEDGREDAGRRGRRRRRRRRNGRDGEHDGTPRAAPSEARGAAEEAGEDGEDEGDDEEPAAAVESGARERVAESDDDGERRRRRGRRGGRRSRREDERPERGERFERGPRLEPVTWVQPGETVPEETTRTIDETIAVAPAAPVPTSDIAPEPAAAAPRAAPEPEPEPAMPRIPDLPELQPAAAPAVDADPGRPRRAGWWNRQRG